MIKELVQSVELTPIQACHPFWCQISILHRSWSGRPIILRETLAKRHEEISASCHMCTYEHGRGELEQSVRGETGGEKERDKTRWGKRLRRQCQRHFHWWGLLKLVSGRLTHIMEKKTGSLAESKGRGNACQQALLQQVQTVKKLQSPATRVMPWFEDRQANDRRRSHEVKAQSLTTPQHTWEPWFHMKILTPYWFPMCLWTGTLGRDEQVWWVGRGVSTRKTSRVRLSVICYTKTTHSHRGRSKRHGSWRQNVRPLCLGNLAYDTKHSKRVYGPPGIDGPTERWSWCMLCIQSIYGQVQHARNRFGESTDANTEWILTHIMNAQWQHENITNLGSRHSAEYRTKPSPCICLSILANSRNHALKGSAFFVHSVEHR